MKNASCLPIAWALKLENKFLSSTHDLWIRQTQKYTGRITLVVIVLCFFSRPLHAGFFDDNRIGIVATGGFIDFSSISLLVPNEETGDLEEPEYTGSSTYTVDIITETFGNNFSFLPYYSSTKTKYFDFVHYGFKLSFKRVERFKDLFDINYKRHYEIGVLAGKSKISPHNNIRFYDDFSKSFVSFKEQKSSVTGLFANFYDRFTDHWAIAVKIVGEFYPVIGKIDNLGTPTEKEYSINTMRLEAGLMFVF